MDVLIALLGAVFTVAAIVVVLGYFAFLMSLVFGILETVERLEHRFKMLDYESKTTQDSPCPPEA